MTKSEMITWLKTEFKPLNIVTPDDTLEQIVDNAFRYWNNNSGFKRVEMVNATEPRTQLSKYTKFVAKVYPASEEGFNPFEGHPLWSLLGITILDNVTSDIITLTEAFKNYQAYVGTAFSWTFEKSDDPEQGGYLYITNTPTGTQKLAVLGCRRIFTDEDIESEYIKDWLLFYSKALLKQVEGNTLRKSNIINVRNDGQEIYDEGKEEMQKLQEQLAKDGRWVVLGHRF